MIGPDVCVIGGGPAGLTAAISLRLAGHSVTVIEANHPPIDKACGEGLMPDTLEALYSLGIRFDDGLRFRGVRFIRGKAMAQADFATGYGLGIRRTALHRALVARATELDVDLRWNAKNVRLDGTFLVAADGQNSHIRRSNGFVEKSASCRYGFRRHYAVAPWSDYVEVYWGERRQIYVTPIARDQVGVALLTSNPRERLADALPYFPEIVERLCDARNVSSEMGAVTGMRRLRNVRRGSIVLVGDASGSVDAITGEGIGLAARQAIALAEAVRINDLERYEQRHSEIMKRPRMMAKLLLVMARSGGLQKFVIGSLSRAPVMFETLLAAHVRSGTVTAGALSSASLPNPERLKIQS